MVLFPHPAAGRAGGAATFRTRYDGVAESGESIDIDAYHDGSYIGAVSVNLVDGAPRTPRSPGSPPRGPGRNGGGPGGSGGGPGGGGGPTDPPAAEEAQPPGFTDVNPQSAHAANINALHAAGITTGCSTQPARYCPNQPVTRAQMATFLVRALELPTAAPAGFADVNPQSAHAAHIDAPTRRRHHHRLLNPTSPILPKPTRHTSPNGHLPRPRAGTTHRRTRRLHRRQPTKRPRSPHQRPTRRRHHHRLLNPTSPILPKPTRHTSPNGHLLDARPRSLVASCYPLNRCY